MKKISTIFLGILILAPLLAWAPDSFAIHERTVNWCEFSSDVNIVSLGINVGETQRLQTIKAGAKFETSTFDLFNSSGVKTGSQNVDEVTGTGTLVGIVQGPNYGQTSNVPLSNIWPGIRDKFSEVCSQSSSGLKSKTVKQDQGFISCTIGSKDDFGGGKKGLNIESFTTNPPGGNGKVVGLKADKTINNDYSQLSPVFLRVYDSNTGVWLIQAGDVLGGSNDAKAIAHNANLICAKNATSGASTPLSPPPSGAPSGGSSGSGGTTGSGSGSGGGASAGSGSGASAGSGANVSGAGVKESCFVKDKIEIKDSSGSTISFENREVGPADTEKWGVVCLINTINTVTDWIFFVILALSFAFILIAGFFWMTAGAKAENQKKAGQMILAALVGIAIAIMARVIPGIVIGILA